MLEALKNELIRAENIISYDDKIAAISDLKEEAQLIRKEFLDFNFSSLKEGDSKTYFNLICEYYYVLALFPDKEILQKFESLGITKEHQKWFISLSEIEQQLEELNEKQNIEYKLYEIICLHKAHLSFNILNEVQLCFSELIHYYNPKKKVNLASYLYNRFKKNKKNQPKKPRKEDDIYFTFEETESEINRKFEGIEQNKSMMQDFLLGKTGKYHIQLLIQVGFIRPYTMSDTKFYSAIYDFIRFITKHPEMKDVTGLHQLEGYDSIEQYKYRRIYSLFMR